MHTGKLENPRICLTSKNPACDAVRREAEEDWSK